MRSSPLHIRHVRAFSAFRQVRGMRDLFSDEMEQRSTIVECMQRIVKSYGFQQIQTPVLEYTNLYAQSLGTDSDIVNKEMYTFLDRSGTSVSLRPEGTASVLRALTSSKLRHQLPQKLFYNENMYRYERPQRGRFREFQQFGVEYIGSTGYSTDLEIFVMVNSVLEGLCIKEKLSLHVNTLGDLESRARYKAALTSYFSNCIDMLSEDSKQRFERGSILRILDSKDGQDAKIISGAPRLSQYVTGEAAERFEKLRTGLSLFNIEFTHNERLVRGLDYYCDTVFEYVERKQDTPGQVSEPGLAVLAGGCYNGLGHDTGRLDAPCIGWAAGVDRLCLLCNIPQSRPKLIASHQPQVMLKAMEISQVLRQLEFVVHFCHGNQQLKKQIKSAERLKCDYAVLLGESELGRKEVRIKNLESRMEQTINWDELDALSFN